MTRRCGSRGREGLGWNVQSAMKPSMTEHQLGPYGRMVEPLTGKMRCWSLQNRWR